MYATPSIKVTGNSHRKQSFLFSGKVVAKKPVAAYHKISWLRERE